MDEENWAISEIVIQIGHWYSARHVRISPWDIERISYERSTVFTLFSAEDIDQTGEDMRATVRKANLVALGLEE